MAGLSDILPKDQLIDRFGTNLVLEEYGKSALRTIGNKKPLGPFGLAANVWNIIVLKGRNPVDPQQLAHYFEAADPNLHLAI
jgi:hypothetical protein